MAATVDKNRALKLLGSGLSGEAVATALGCDPSYISQLMAEEHFREQVIALRTQALTAASERDRRVDTLEERGIEKLEQMIDWITKPREMLQFFQVLNGAKRRGVSAPDSLVINQQIVNLQLPATPLKQLTLSTTGEVIEVDGQSMLTMQPTQLLEQLVREKGHSDEAAKTLKALRSRDIATPGYESRTDKSGNRASLSQGNGREAFDI